MKTFAQKFILLFVIIYFCGNILHAQTKKRIPGKSNALISDKVKTYGNSAFQVPLHINNTFSTTVYTFGDISIFSYFDDTHITITNQFGSVVSDTTLAADKIYSTRLISGIYKVQGNKTYTVLVGDAISNNVNGYFAVDEAGRGASTRLNTWMMKSYQSGDDFIVFAYNDNTGFTVKDLESGNIIFAGTLNKGKHYSFREAGNIPFSKSLQVTGTQPVSALSYTDQDYYVPSANGTFSGTLFYGYSAYNGSWANSITVTSYSDNNNVQVINSNTGAVISSFTLQKGQVHSDKITEPTFWTVTSTYTVTAANIPYVSFAGYYYYMARSIDETGKGFGKLFYVPTIGSRLDVFSFEANNNVKITRLGLYNEFPYTSPEESSVTLNEGEDFNTSSTYGSYVYKIEATGNVSVLQSNGGAGADFMCLAYSLDYPDLAVSNADIEFSKADSLLNAGDNIKITVTVHNYGSKTATNINCVAYEGDPDLGGSAPPVGSGNILSISPNSTDQFSFNYTIPPNPEYRIIVVKVDPNGEITESNKSNNKAQKSLKPNNDLMPPLAVSVTAPASLALVNGQLSPNPFKVRYDIFNTGTVAAENVKAVLELQNGLSLSSGTLKVILGQIPGNASNYVEYTISANPSVSGFNFYKLTVTCDNAPTKIINRAVNVPDAVPPSRPQNLEGTVTGGSTVNLTWKANSETDLSGYYLYYSTDGINFNATGANEGNSPILVLNSTSLVITGLPVTNPNGTPYWFLLKAFDSSNNLSDASNVVNLQLTSQTSDEIIFYGNSAFLYSVSNGTGYVTGPNSYNDIGKYQRFDFPGQKFLKAIRIYFGTKTINGSADEFKVVVRDVAANGEPSSLKYSLVSNTNEIDVTAPVRSYNTYTINPPIQVNNTFFAGVEWDSTINDSFAIISDSTSEGENAKRAWERWSDGTFHDMSSAWTDFDVDLWIAAVLSTSTNTEEEAVLPDKYLLSQNYPNPFNPNTKIKYELPNSGYVILKVYNILGNEIATLVKGERQAGVYNVNFNAKTLASGTYFYRLQIFDSNSFLKETYSETKKLLLLK